MLYSAVGSFIYYSGQDKKIDERGKEKMNIRRYVSSFMQRTLSSTEEFCFTGIIQQKKAILGQMIDGGGVVRIGKRYESAARWRKRVRK